MGFDDFFIQSNNGKRIKFEDLKNLKPEDIAQNPALQKIITLFDIDESGNIDTPDEWNTVFGELQRVAESDGDKVLSYSEMGLFLKNKQGLEEVTTEEYDDFVEKMFMQKAKSKTRFSQENGVNYEDEVLTVDGKIQKLIKKQDGIVISITEYEYKEDGTIKLTTKTLNNTQVETFVKEVDEEGNYLASDFVSRKTTMPNGSVSKISQLETGHIVETIKNDNSELTTIYNTSSIYAFDYFKDEPELKLAQVYVNDNKEYVVRYANGNTITHAASGDGIERLVKNLGFENSEQLYKHNPELKNKTVKVGQEIVVPRVLNANDSAIVGQGSLNEEFNEYLTVLTEQNIQKFKNEKLSNINQEVFQELQKLKGFELNNKNIYMYFKLNELDEVTQQKVLQVIVNASETNATVYEVKRAFLKSSSMPKEKLEDGTEIPINLFAGPTMVIKDSTSAFTQNFSYETFITDTLGLDITKGEGKDLYERLLNIKDSRVLQDAITMFSNIRMRSNDALLENFQNKMNADLRYYGGATSTLGKSSKIALDNNKALSAQESLEMYKSVIRELTEPRQQTKFHNFVEQYKDTYLRQFAADMIYMLHTQSQDLITNVRANKGALSPSKYVLAFPEYIYKNQSDRIYNFMKRDVYLGNDKFSQTQQGYTYGYKVAGKPFDKERVKKCYEIICDKNASEHKKKQALIDAFGGPIVNEAEDLIGTTDFLDNVTDIALLIYGTGIIGKALTTGMSALRGTSAVQKAGVLFSGTTKAQNFTNLVTQMGLSATTFAIYDGLKYTIDYYTNDIDETQLGENSYSYLDGLGSTVVHSAAFGAFAAGWGQEVTGRILKNLFKTPQVAEVSRQAMRTVNKTLGNSVEFTSSKLMKTYTNAQTKAMTSAGREVVSFGSELVGFSVWEILNSDAEKSVSEVLENQFETLLSFKTVGHIIKMHKAGKGFGGANNFGKVKDLKFESVSENGKSGYKVTYPDGKEAYVKNLEEAVVLSNNYYENKTLYEPLEKILKNEKVDLGEGIVISKEGNNYVIDLDGRTRISEPNLKVAMLKAQNQHSFYKLEQRARTEHEITLPNQMKITYDKENNMYETTLEGGEKVKAESVEKLFVDASQMQLKIDVDKEILNKGSMMLGEDTRLTKTADNLYQAEVILSNGKKLVVKKEFINDVLAEVNFVKIMYKKFGEVRSDYLEDQNIALNIDEYKRKNPLDVEQIRSSYQPNVAELFERCYKTHPDFVIELLKSSECDMSNLNPLSVSDVNDKIAKLLVCATEHPEMVSYMKDLYSQGYGFTRITNKTRTLVAQNRNLNNNLTSNEIYTPEDVRDLTKAIKNRPEIKSDILECASKKMTYRQTIEKINSLDARRLELRTSLEEKYPEQMAQLKTTLGEEFFSQVKWEKHILSDFSEAQAFETLNVLNNSAKFFARTTTNEQRYGKNFNWAISMNEISTHAQEAIRNGKSGREILDLIAQEYGDFDRAGGVSGREKSGVIRQLTHKGEGRVFNTPFDNLECYPEYFDRFVERCGVARTKPYKDIGLTTFYSENGETDGIMFHPTSDLVKPCLKHVERIHNEMQPLFDKVTRGESLTETEVATAHSKISEIYFLLGNTAPYERGSNGIADIYMRSLYEALKIDMPALKRNVSLDLEAFCMDLPEYQSKWLTFFENKSVTNVAAIKEEFQSLKNVENDSPNSRFISNFDLKLETFKEFLQGLKKGNGEDLFDKKVVDELFSKGTYEEIALKFELVKTIAEEAKISSSSFTDGFTSVIKDLSYDDAKILKELFEVPKAENQSLCINLDSNLLQGNNFANIKLQDVAKLVKVLKETNSPLLNRENIFYLAETSFATEMDLFVEALKVKDKSGDLVLNKNLISILSGETNIPLVLEQLVALDGKIDKQLLNELNSFVDKNCNSDLQIYLLNNVLSRDLVKSEQISEFINNYFDNVDTKHSCNFKSPKYNEVFRQMRLVLGQEFLSKLHFSLEICEVLETFAGNPHKKFLDFISDKCLNEMSRDNMGVFCNVVEVYRDLKGLNDVVKDGNAMKYFVQLQKTEPSRAENLKMEASAYKEGLITFDQLSFELRDIIESARIERFKKLLSFDVVASDIKDFLYEEYLNMFPCEDIYKNKCREINEKYGVKVFMGAYKEVEALDFVREELQAFRDASGGTAKLIDIFDFTSSYVDYINPEGAYGQGVAAGYQVANRIGVNSMRFRSVAHALRHELMHANDLKEGENIDPKYNWDEIAVRKNNGKFDLSKCKYVDDFRRIGIPERHISYAYNNTKEFIAVAAEGDLTRCTPEFKQVLIDFGMPEWMFRIRSHSLAKQQAGVNFKTLCSLGTDGKTYEITKDGQKIIEAEVEKVRKRAAKNLYEDVQFMYDFGLGNPRTMTYRTKSSTSLFDKVKNYLFDNANKVPSLADAMLDIRDANGFRTVIESSDYSSHPEVKALLLAGDKHGAALRAAELQSQPYVDRLIGVMTAFAEGRTNKKPTRISNYKGADGIPYFSERQLREIQLHAKKCGIKLSVVTEFDVKHNSHFSPEELKMYRKVLTTKVREAGYTALQVNFENADGTIFEWQLRGKEVDFFAEREHLPYDLRTNKDITGGNPEVGVLVEDVKNLLKEDNIKPEDYAEYNNYLTAHYRHLRYVELGIPSEAPKLPAKFDSRLKAENLDLLHDFMIKVKEGKMSGSEALAEYMRMLR